MLYQKARAIGSMLKYWGYDIPRYFKYLNYLNYNSTEERFKGVLSMNYHVIEKGLTMAEPRLGFGEAQVFKILDLLNEYLNKGYSLLEFEFIQSVKVLNEYLEFHKKNNHEINEKISTEIKKINQKSNIYSSSEQLVFHQGSFFSYANSSFDKFALSRHSVRNYISKEITDEIIADCIKIAQNAPSSCNRQPIRAYAIKESCLIKNVLDLQSGNRGFGHLSNSLFVITSNLSLFQNFIERNEPAINAGMFSMAFLYALHQKGIGACSLNWSVTPDRDRSLRDLLSIPNNEMIHLIISCGYPPDNFKVAASPRIDVDHILKIIK